VCTLGTESFRPSAAAQCVQLIAMVELPRGLWPGLIQTLVHNVTNPASTEIVKESTLQAVGYICQVTILSYASYQSTGFPDFRIRISGGSYGSGFQSLR
jgi:hypothetical protein